MKITIVMSGGARHRAMLPFENATHCVADVACPSCNAAAPLKISGTGISHQTHDTYCADAVALCCKRRVGIIETRLDTLFGLEEDERVLAGPWRVY